MILQSLPTTPPSLQEIFDHVATHLLTQKKKSVLADNPGFCCYRGSDGSSCAVGCLIPDSIYTSDIEMTGVVRLFEHEMIPDWFHSFGITDREDPKLQFLQQLQNLHDAIGPVGWIQQLFRIAHTYSLTFNPPSLP